MSERRDLLCAFFLLLAVLAYLRGVTGGRLIGSRWWSLSLTAFAAALLSKASAMTLPLTLLVIDVYPLRRRSSGWRELLIEKLPYAMLGGVAALIAVLARHASGDITDYGRYGAGARVALAGHTFWFYPWKFVWPGGLGVMYELPARVDLRTPRFLVPFIAVVVITIALVVLRRRWPAGLAAWVYSAIVLLPVSGLVHSGNQLAADRYSYLSGFGFALLAGGGLTWSMRRAQRSMRPWLLHAVVTTACLVLTALGAMAWAQTMTWRDSETLWTTRPPARPSMLDLREQPRTRHREARTVRGSRGARASSHRVDAAPIRTAREHGCAHGLPGTVPRRRSGVQAGARDRPEIRPVVEQPGGRARQPGATARRGGGGRVP